MDAKRIIPVLTLLEGRILVPSEAIPDLDPGRPAEWACQLEAEGADGILFRETDAPGPARESRTRWLRDVAGALGIPFTLEAPLRRWDELEEVLQVGADRVILTVPAPGEDPLLTAAAQTFGRSRVGVAVDAALGPDARWRVASADDPQGRDALAWMSELNQWGAGEIILQAAPEGPALAELLQAAARLPLALVLRTSAGPEVAAEALLHGADGLAYPAFSRTPERWKFILGARGLPLRG
jgi:imidazole glycerol phosphate synthase subunit HisF